MRIAAVERRKQFPQEEESDHTEGEDMVEGELTTVAMKEVTLTVKATKNTDAAPLLQQKEVKSISDHRSGFQGLFYLVSWNVSEVSKASVFEWVRAEMIPLGHPALQQYFETRTTEAVYVFIIDNVMIGITIPHSRNDVMAMHQLLENPLPELEKHEPDVMLVTKEVEPTAKRVESTSMGNDGAKKKVV